ncbi:hypothetical protein, partial [Corynebacterium tuscaniense]|uniref:hypothetical protein n=1 Tax=Corynebacterium tuscaniense TaxID=302449 RepID=UPI001B868337
RAGLLRSSSGLSGSSPVFGDPFVCIVGGGEGADVVSGDIATAMETTKSPLSGDFLYRLFRI